MLKFFVDVCECVPVHITLVVFVCALFNIEITVTAQRAVCGCF